MALLLNQLEIEPEPLVPELVDPAWEDEVRRAMGMVPRSMRTVASSGWVRRTYLDAVTRPLKTIPDPEAELAGLVVSQENACRYCYGVARTRMKMMGFSDEMIDRIERNVQLVESDARERELVSFCRSLARSKPRPSRQAREALMAAGFTALQTAELSYLVLVMGFCNRVSTLLGTQPEVEMEAAPVKGFWHKLSSWIPKRESSPRQPPPPYPDPSFAGPYGELVRVLDGVPGAAVLEKALNGAFASEVLPRRTLALIFAVIARTLECGLSESIAAELLAREGVSRDQLAEILATLASPILTPMERLLVPWARDTVWMPEQPAVIQRRTRPLVDALGPQAVIDAVGGAALANGCVRLAMLVT